MRPPGNLAGHLCRQIKPPTTPCPLVVFRRAFRCRHEPCLSVYQPMSASVMRSSQGLTIVNTQAIRATVKMLERGPIVVPLPWLLSPRARHSGWLREGYSHRRLSSAA